MDSKELKELRRIFAEQLDDVFEIQIRMNDDTDKLLANCYQGFKQIYDKSNDIDVRITCSNAKILIDKHYEKQKHDPDS